MCPYRMKIASIESHGKYCAGNVRAKLGTHCSLSRDFPAVRASIYLYTDSSLSLSLSLRWIVGQFKYGSTQLDIIAMRRELIFGETRLRSGANNVAQQELKLGLRFCLEDSGNVTFGFGSCCTQIHLGFFRRFRPRRKPIL